MISRRNFLDILAVGLGSAALCDLTAPRARAGARLPESPTLDQIASRGLKDLEAHVQVVSADQAELAKINRDFGMAYRLKSLTMRYKEPNKLRMDGSIGCLIINGPTRHFRVPAIKLSKTDDLGESPGKRYTLMDIGLLTEGGLAGVRSRYLRDEQVDGETARVFEITYKDDDSVKYVAWVDQRTHVLVKREWYDGSGKRKATFSYREPKQVAADLWVPTRIEIRNPENVVAAVTSYSDVKVNQGLDDSLFKIA
jgi:outer membrane lipoprotein-sorting protein